MMNHVGGEAKETLGADAICVFFMQHFFGIAPIGLCGGVFFIVCGNTSGSVITATEGGIPRSPRSVSKRKGRKLRRGTAPGGSGV
jgi:hypothetical protein